MNRFDPVKFLTAVIVCFFLKPCAGFLKAQMLQAHPDSTFRQLVYGSLSPEKKQEAASLREDIIRVARKYLGVRYRNAGKYPWSGFDCSGFTGYVFKTLGVPLKTSSAAQSAEGKKVPLNRARKGDLAFFGHKGKRGRWFVNHAAIVISEPGEPLAIIHSASRKGIIITRINEDPYWRRNLLFVKSVL